MSRSEVPAPSLEQPTSAKVDPSSVDLVSRENDSLQAALVGYVRQQSSDSSENSARQQDSSGLAVVEQDPVRELQADSGSSLVGHGSEPDGAGKESIDSRPTVEEIAAPAQPIEHFVALALAANPKLIAIRHEIAALRYRVPQVKSLPNPQLAETFWPFQGNALETAGGTAASQLSLSQGIPWPEKLSTKAAIACRDVQIALTELEQAELEIAESVRLACIELWLAGEALEIIDESGKLVGDLNRVTEAKYRSGESNTAQHDVLRAQTEGDRLEEQRIVLQQKRDIAEANLAALLHQPYADRLRVNEPPLGDQASMRLEELVGLAFECNPELRGLAHEIAKEREQTRLACLDRYPDFQVGMNWLIVSDDDAISPVANGNDNFGFTVGMSLPIWRKKIDAGIAEASHRTSSTAGTLASQRDTTVSQLRGVLAQADGLAEQQRIYAERILPRTEDTLKLALVDYAGNRTDFRSVVETYRELLVLELQLLRIRASLAKTLVQLERLVGCPID